MEGSTDQTTKAISELSMDSSTSSTAAPGAGDGAGTQSKKYVFLSGLLFTLDFSESSLDMDFDCGGLGFRENVAVL